MSDEELNKKMEFIVEHQAKFASDMEIMRETQAADVRLLKEHDRILSSAMLGLVEVVGNLARAQTRTDEEINRLTQTQSETSESLKILINVVERHISGNGGLTGPA